MSTSSSSSRPPPPALNLPQNLACGAIARTTQILSMYPVDTIKVRMQVSRTAATSSLAAVSSAISRGALYKGALFSLIGQVPYGMLTFGAYETLRTKFRVTLRDYPDWLQLIIAAAMGDTIGSLWLTPSEVIKSKTQAGVYASPMAAVGATAKTGLGGFYQGYSAALARDIPFRMIQLTLYERLRVWYRTSSFRKDVTKQLSSLENLLIGAIAGTATAAATTPLDVIRTRMMSQAAGSGQMYNNAFDCVAKTVGKEGIGALLKGVTPRCMLIGPSSAVFFLAYEMSKTFFRNQQLKKQVSSSGNQQTSHNIAFNTSTSKLSPALCRRRPHAMCAYS